MPVSINGIPVILADGVRETTQTTGAGTYSLNGPATVSGVTYRTFVAGVGSGNVTAYTVRSGGQFEIGIGTVTSGAPATLTRSTILKSSNGNNAVSWGAGTKDIICGAPADLFHSLQVAIDTAAYANRFKTTVLTSSGTFTRDGDCLFAQVRIVGGGGAGGGAQATNAEHSEGGGGGGSEYAEGWFTAAQIGTSQSVTIGAGGTAVSGGTGNNGGTTSFGSLMTALGGTGGAAGPPTTTSNQTEGGLGGSGGSGGTFRIRGDRGGMGAVRGGAWQGQGTGGASHLSGAANSASGAVTTGQLYGGGGEGASNATSQANGPGGAGAAGVCIVIEFCRV